MHFFISLLSIQWHSTCIPFRSLSVSFFCCFEVGAILQSSSDTKRRRPLAVSEERIRLGSKFSTIIDQLITIDLQTVGSLSVFTAESIPPRIAQRKHVAAIGEAQIFGYHVVRSIIRTALFHCGVGQEVGKRPACFSGILVS